MPVSREKGSQRLPPLITRHQSSSGLIVLVSRTTNRHCQFRTPSSLMSDSTNTSNHTRPATATATMAAQDCSHLCSLARILNNSTSPEPELDDFSERMLGLKILQQPICVRTSARKDRARYITPPPILQLTIEDYDENKKEDREALKWCYNIVRCQLVQVSDEEVESALADAAASPHNSPGTRENSEGSEDSSSRASESQKTSDYDVGADSSAAFGHTVASPLIVPEPDATFESPSPSGSLVTYFAFADIRVREPGFYRLRFELTHIDERALCFGGSIPIAAYALSDIFESAQAKNFPGVQPASKLHHYLRARGYDVRPIAPPESGSQCKRGRSRQNRRSDDAASPSRRQSA